MVVMGSDSICNVPINTNWIDICYAGCQPDKDGDNIPDSRDIDDDNDGISDSQELNCGPAASTATVTTTTGNAQVITGQYTYNGAVVNATTTFSSVNTAFMATSVVSGNGIHYLANDTGTDGTYSTTFTLTPANGNIGIDTIWFGPNLAGNAIATASKDMDSQNITLTWTPAIQGIVVDPSNQLSQANGQIISSVLR
ncbi:MAG: hypothetical protein IPG00_21255 [Saprospiraceae bacterium]|nr:hypothetical protein [Saprospiraceae bacterium]